MAQWYGASSTIMSGMNLNHTLTFIIFTFTIIHKTYFLTNFVDNILIIKYFYQHLYQKVSYTTTSINNIKYNNFRHFLGLKEHHVTFVLFFDIDTNCTTNIGIVQKNNKW